MPLLFFGPIAHSERSEQALFECHNSLRKALFVGDDGGIFEVAPKLHPTDKSCEDVGQSHLDKRQQKAVEHPRKHNAGHNKGEFRDGAPSLMALKAPMLCGGVCPTSVGKHTGDEIHRHKDQCNNKQRPYRSKKRQYPGDNSRKILHKIENGKLKIENWGGERLGSVGSVGSLRSVGPNSIW